MMSKQQNSTYLSYLVRLWPEGENWRATAENVHSGERHAFASLSALFAFIAGQSIEILEGKTDPNKNLE